MMNRIVSRRPPPAARLALARVVEPGPGLALACALLCAACGSSSQVDPYNGVVFSTDGTTYAWDVHFVPSTDTPCVKIAGSYACYPVQLGSANGKPIQFYQLNPFLYASASNPPPTVSALQSRNLPDPTCTASGATSATCTCSNGGTCIIPPTVANKNLDYTGGSHADVFADGSCTPDTSYDSRTDAYQSLVQGPVFDSLPLQTSNTSYFAIVWPVVATYDVTGVKGMNCNDIKNHSSIGNPGQPGSFGAQRSAAPKHYKMWPVIDPNAVVNSFSSLSSSTDPGWGPKVGWYNGLLLNYLDGGEVPTKQVTDSHGNPVTTLVTMEAAIVNPSSGSYSNVTDPSVVVFPVSPGDFANGWSPIVRLHNFKAASGKAVSYYNGICATGQANCPATYIPAVSISASSYNTIFVVAPPQQ
jgi:hypothetical protein